MNHLKIDGQGDIRIEADPEDRANEVARRTKAFVMVCLAVADTIRDLGSVPSGHLYAQLMPTGMSLDNYNSIITHLKNAGLVENRFDELFWVGPNQGETAKCSTCGIRPPKPGQQTCQDPKCPSYSFAIPY